MMSETEAALRRARLRPVISALAALALGGCAISTVPVFEQARVRTGGSWCAGMRAEAALQNDVKVFWEGGPSGQRTRFMSAVASGQYTYGSDRSSVFIRAEAGPGFVLASELESPAAVQVFPWTILVGAKYYFPSSGTAIRFDGGYQAPAQLQVLQDIGRNWTVGLGTANALALAAGVGFHHSLGPGTLGHLSLAVSAWPSVGEDEYPLLLGPWAASIGYAIEGIRGTGR